MVVGLEIVNQGAVGQIIDITSRSLSIHRSHLNSASIGTQIYTDREAHRFFFNFFPFIRVIRVYPCPNFHGMEKRQTSKIHVLFHSDTVSKQEWQVQKNLLIP